MDMTMEEIKRNRIQMFLVLFGAVFFNIAFWHEKLALNLFVFNLFTATVLLIFNPKALKSKSAMISVAGTIVASGAVLMHNSAISKIAAIASVIAMIGLVQFPTLRSVWHGAKTAIINFFRAPEILITLFRKTPKRPTRRFGKTLKLSLIPIAILLVFFFIFKIANPVFSELSNELFSSIGDFFSNFFDYFSFWRVYFFIIGLGIVNWIVYKGFRTFFVKKEASKDVNLVRKRNRVRNVLNTTPSKEKHVYRFKHIPTLGLKNENLMAAITMGLVCLLLIIVNTIDIIYVWFGFEYAPNEDLSARVHEGTYLLILSIVLSMVVMLIFFRKNLNFYKKNKTIRALSFFWLAQNVVLVTSVIIRNIYYINHQGITHKRIGVFIFLILTIVGLITLFFKISNRKSTFFLLLQNGWAVYTMLIVMALVNWDVMIVRYNVSHPNQDQIDYVYLLGLSDEAVTILNESKVLQNAVEGKNASGGNYQVQMLSKLKYRLSNMESRRCRYRDCTFLSWNYRDQKVTYYVENHKKK